VFPGAACAVLDRNASDTILSAYSDADVVINTVGDPVQVVRRQDSATGAQSTSVKLFLLSGLDRYRFQRSIFRKELELSRSLFFPGVSTDFQELRNQNDDDGAPENLDWTFVTGKVHSCGEGTTQLSFIFCLDIARYVVHVLTTLPAFKLGWCIFASKVGVCYALTLHENLLFVQ
jgi:hypothetical protein